LKKLTFENLFKNVRGKDCARLFVEERH